MIYKINGDRLIDNLFNLGKIGMNKNGGIDRDLGSQADYDARQWILKYWKDQIGLDPEIDAIANLWMRCDGIKNGLLPLIVGSHHDAVPDGGKYDGAMGVLIATEIMQTVKEQNIQFRHPLEVISFTGEEPNKFNVSTLGSKVISGRLVKEDLLKAKNRETGESLKDAIHRLGGNVDDVENARIFPRNIAAFIEPHNELGRHLESEGLKLSSVSYITGIYREEIIIYGEANHAGTTMMQDRKDALLGAAELALEIEKIAKKYNNPEVVATVGYIKAQPNEANIVPGEVKMLLDVRTCSNQIQEEIISNISQAVLRIENERAVRMKRESILNQECRKLDDIVTKAIDEGIKNLKEPQRQIVSMAGHDAANMGMITKSGMIFVQSVGGKGHCRQEFSRNEDIIKAANATLFALIKLDKELD